MQLHIHISESLAEWWLTLTVIAQGAIECALVAILLILFVLYMQKSR